MADSHAPSALAHQFEDLEQQHEAASLGMWIFLATEVIFFGGLFAGYTLYRNLYLPGFEAEPPSERHHRRHQHRRVDLQQLDHGTGGAGRANGK